MEYRQATHSAEHMEFVNFGKTLTPKDIAAQAQYVDKCEHTKTALCKELDAARDIYRRELRLLEKMKSAFAEAAAQWRENYKGEEI